MTDDSIRLLISHNGLESTIYHSIQKPSDDIKISQPLHHALYPSPLSLSLKQTLRFSTLIASTVHRDIDILLLLLTMSIQKSYLHRLDYARKNEERKKKRKRKMFKNRYWIKVAKPRILGNNYVSKGDSFDSTTNRAFVSIP